LTGLEAHLLQVARGRYSEEVIQQVCGWSPDEWAAAAPALWGRGLLTAGPPLTLTDTGSARLETIEARTGEGAWTGGLSLLGEQGVDEVVTLLLAPARAVASAILPAVNPTGFPSPS
jgi:hypothetical protein